MRAGSADSTGVVTDHGGSLARADRRFPDAPKPWLDLSTGINARSYPVPAFAASAFERLPEEADMEELAGAAAAAYGAPSAGCVVCAPGTQILLPLVAGLVAPGRAAVLSPTYAEHARAAALAGHFVAEAASPEALAGADLAVVVNPNNPDGALCGRAALLGIASRLRARGGVLVVDEAFMDVGPRQESLAGDAGDEGIVVLRSFGKFFGLAGLRLGFAICSEDLAARLRARLGPWAVSGPALATGRAALADRDWQERMRADLSLRAGRLDGMLRSAGLDPRGGTSLYRFLRDARAPQIADALGRRGILVRCFSFDATALRFGVPGADADFDRLAAALDAWSRSR